MLNKHLGCFGDKFWGEEDHSVEDSGKVEGRNGSLQTEASLQVYNVDSEDLMRWLTHDVLALFPGPKGEAGKVVPLPGPPGAEGLPGSPGFQGPQGTLKVLVHLEI